jgi:hypothetical protein
MSFGSSGIRNPPVLIETLEAHKSTGKKKHTHRFYVLRKENGIAKIRNPPVVIETIEAHKSTGKKHTSKATNRYFSRSLSSASKSAPALLLRSTGTSKSSSLSLYVSVSKSKKSTPPRPLTATSQDPCQAPQNQPQLSCFVVRPSLEQALWENPKMSSHVWTGPQRQVPLAS